MREVGRDDVGAVLIQKSGAGDIFALRQGTVGSVDTESNVGTRIEDHPELAAVNASLLCPNIVPCCREVGEHKLDSLSNSSRDNLELDAVDSSVPCPNLVPRGSEVGKNSATSLSKSS